MAFFCIEILGESSFHKCLVQSGWSGKDYAFFYNAPTGTHLRAYRDLKSYLAERVDLHRSANVWPLLGNLIEADRLEAHTFVDAEAPTSPRTQRKGSKATAVQGGEPCP